MEIKRYTISDLRTVLSSSDFWHTETLPITKHRIASHIHNPRGDQDDTVLLVAYHGSAIIGYIGVLPDRIFSSENSYKIGWLTGWWVDPQRGSAGVGTALLFKALNAYDQQIGVSGSSKDAGKVLQASQKFFPIDALRGTEIAFEAHPWPKEEKDRVAGLSVEYISQIDGETEALIQRHNQRDLTRKEKADLDWIVTYPWVLSAPRKDSASKRYYFSSVAKRFFYLGVKLFDGDKQFVGFFVLKVRNEKASLIFSYFEDKDAKALATAAIDQAQAMGATQLTLYGERMVKSLPSIAGPDVSTKKVSRGFMLTKAFENETWKNCRLQGGDGDLAFY